MTPSYTKVDTQKHQSGVVLVITIIMLLLLSMIAVTGMQVTGIEEKMASNTKDKEIAFQAAEIALRYAEIDIDTSGRIDGTANGFSNNCANGLCVNAAQTAFNNIEDFESDAVAIDVNNGNISSTSFPEFAEQPKYLITAINTTFDGGVTNTIIYQITAFGTGRVSTTKSVLQELYLPGVAVGP